MKLRLELVGGIVMLCLALVLPVSADILADATAGNVSAVRQALDAGADVNAVSAAGATLLHCAVAARSVDLVELLLERKAGLEARNADGATPLLLDMLPRSGNLSSNLEIMKLLVAAGARLDAKDKQGRSPLSQVGNGNAIRAGYDAIAGPVFVAAVRGDLTMAQDYFARGGSTDVFAPMGRFGEGRVWTGSPFVRPEAIAACKGHAAVLQLLLQKGAKATSGMLEGAARAGRAATVSLLLSKGVKMSGQALCNAAKSGNVALAKLLLAKLTPAQVRSNSEWLWIGTNESKSVEMAKVIVSKGVSVNFHDALGYTPLHDAAYAGNLAMVKYLISKGAKVNARTGCPGHPTPLALAKKAKRPNAEIIRYLKAHGAK
jgi:ankyrin repeat protein